MTDFESKKAKKEQITRLSHNLWLFLLAPLFLLLIFWRLYQWSLGKDEFENILLPLGMIFVGLSTIIGERSKPLYYLFLGAAFVSLAIAIAMMFIR